MMLPPFAHFQSRRTARVDLFRSLPTVQNGMDVLRCFVAAQIVIVASNETERKRHTHTKNGVAKIYIVQMITKMCVITNESCLEFE